MSLSIQETLDSDLSSADAVRFKPVQLSEPNGTIEQTNGCRPLQFSPAASAIPLSQKSNDADAVAYGYPFDVDNIANDFELHQKPLYLRHSFMQDRATGRRPARLRLDQPLLPDRPDDHPGLQLLEHRSCPACRGNSTSGRVTADDSMQRPPACQEYWSTH